MGSDSAGSEAIPRTASGAARWRTRAAAPTPGRCSPPIPSAISCSCRPAARRPTTTARCGSATTATPTRSSRCARRRASWSWAFQTVHHDLWDYDNASPPALVTLTRNGADVPAVVQATKTRHALRARPRNRPADLSGRGAPGSRERHPAARKRRATQPFTAVTPPLSPHRFTRRRSLGHRPTRIARRAARQSSRLRNEGIFTPPSLAGHARHAVEHRRRALGRRRHRSGAADRDRSGQPHSPRWCS